jgi:hypothetical protein
MGARVWRFGTSHEGSFLHRISFNHLLTVSIDRLLSRRKGI